MAEAALSRQPTPSNANSFRISAVADRLFMHIRAGISNDSSEFFNLCVSLARGIDYAVANNEVPALAPDLPLLLKQVCQSKNDPLLQAAIMVLMISVKNACHNGWFTENAKNELHILSYEIGSSFCSVDINVEVSSFLPTISTIMSRFYPRMKMGQILALLEVKPGYGAFVKDFQILKNGRSSPEDKIRLLVAQTDNIDTSACIITPLQVNFLLNGKGVERRTNIYMDTGPQIPTSVTHMLKYGTNLLQAVGQFNGKYIIVVAFMSMTSAFVRPTLPNYIPPAIDLLDSDSEIIEGPSRISLNCPISFRRIKTPVKGLSCKHLQCFDFDNFVEINSRRPSWRCPHCNQYVCFTDIHIDQNMVKVLREVEENVVDVMFSADGSWKAVTKSDEHTDRQQNKTPTGALQQEKSTSFSGAPLEILDLTDVEGDTEMNKVSSCEYEDRKPSTDTFQRRITANYPPNQTTNIMSEVNRYPSLHAEDGFRLGTYLTPHEIEASHARSVTQNISGGTSISAPVNILTETVSPPPGTNGLISTTSAQNQMAIPNNIQLQQYGNSNMNEYGRFPTVGRQVNRTPIAIQALPAQPLASVSTNAEKQQFSRSQSNLLQGPQMISSSSMQHMGKQNCGNQDCSSFPPQPTQQLRMHPSSAQTPNVYRLSPAIRTDRPQPQQTLNQRIPQPMTQSPGMPRSSTNQPAPHLAQTQLLHGGAQSGVGMMAGRGGGGNIEARCTSAARRALEQHRLSQSRTTPLIQTSRPSPSVLSVTADALRAAVRDQRGNAGVTSQADAARTETVDACAADQNWRPSGRMRGSLSGQAYSDALSQYIIQPTQPVQTARPNITSPPSLLPPQLQVLLANRNSQPQTLSRPGASGQGSEALPDQSVGKK